PQPLSCKERGARLIVLTSPPTPRLVGEGSKISGSPFPCREGGWGVRFFDLLRMLQDLNLNGLKLERWEFIPWWVLR
ncbi:MAG TPA: hypothetical protein DEG47_10715, partial [Cyanobacteria bacterium UBA11148]|nr:hypothetical protein [Cyanobacteria bacterium UBA11148]